MNFSSVEFVQKEVMIKALFKKGTTKRLENSLQY